MSQSKAKESAWSLRLTIIAMLCTATSGIVRVADAKAWTGAAVSGLIIAVGSLLLIVFAVATLLRQRRRGNR